MSLMAVRSVALYTILVLACVVYNINNLSSLLYMTNDSAKNNLSLLNNGENEIWSSDVKRVTESIDTTTNIDMDMYGFQSKRDKHTSPRKALMCVIAINEEAYIDEWVDYHYALGFDNIHIYDNSKLFDLKRWAETKGDHVEVTHFAHGAQRAANLDCVEQALKEGITWAAFFDIDEFLVLRKHDDVHDMLEEHLESGSLGINWIEFHPTSKDLIYSPLPVTKRFMYRRYDAHPSVKSIVKLSDLDMNLPRERGEFQHPHVFKLNVNSTHDTNGNYFRVGRKAQNPTGPEDVAVLHHYHKKSFKEHIAKRERGRAENAANRGDTLENPKAIKQLEGAIKIYQAAVSAESNDQVIRLTAGEKEVYFDDSAWQLLKKNVPAYALFDTLHPQNGENDLPKYDPEEMVESLTEGQSIKCLGRNYRYTDGQRRVYSSDEIHSSWEDNLDNVKSIGAPACYMIIEGAPMEMKL